ncbi:MAG: HEAT repeat domain-containing protein, partial [Acidobacteriota bacterium]
MKNHYGWMPLALLAFSIVAAASDPLATQIKNPDEKLRQEAAERLGKTGGRSAVPVLAAALRDPSEKVRRKVIIALDRLRYPETLEPLRQATQDPTPELARLAILALVNHSTGRELSLGVTGRLKTLGSKVKRGFEPDDTRIDSDVRVDPLTIKALENVLKRKR